jgi:Brp/Blh family beta-carotene 15,15'-monooxygenase
MKLLSVLEVESISGLVDNAPPVARQAGFSLLSFWVFAGITLLAWAAGLPLDGEMATAAAAGLILIGGLPHGGHDLHLARRAYRLGPAMTALFLAAYLGAALAMLALWALAPVAALAGFLLLSATHFADDWRDTPARAGVGESIAALGPLEGLLRFAAGLAVISAAAIGQQDAVSELFVAMAGAEAIWVARIAVAAGPVVLLVAAVAIWQIWNSGARQRAAATVMALVLLLLTPPLIGFAMFFALLHAPRHIQDMQPLLRKTTAVSTLMNGWIMALLAAGLWLWVAPNFLVGSDVFGPSGLFQLLSVVTVPHLACSHRLNRYLAEAQAKGPEGSHPPAPKICCNRKGVPRSSRQKAGSAESLTPLQPPPDQP